MFRRTLGFVLAVLLVLGLPNERSRDALAQQQTRNALRSAALSMPRASATSGQPSNKAFVQPRAHVALAERRQHLRSNAAGGATVRITIARGRLMDMEASSSGRPVARPSIQPPMLLT